MHIFFDFDGTLVDITERWWQLHIDVASAFGLPRCTDREEYVSQKRSGTCEADIMKKISRDEERIREYDAERIRRIELPKYLAHDTLFGDAVPTLGSLREQGHTLAVITNRGSYKNFLDEFRALGLPEYITDIYTSDRVSKKESLARRHNPRTLARSLFVSDDIEDMETAQRFGMQSVVAGYGCRTGEFLASRGAKTIIPAFSDVLLYVND
ncbi:MAG: HAD family hydrolase [Parcubacteria group bacterium]|nr:HAD family hydrolase [Parcubacteria group bacterium]